MIHVGLDTVFCISGIDHNYDKTDVQIHLAYIERPEGSLVLILNAPGILRFHDNHKLQPVVHAWNPYTTDFLRFEAV